MEMADPVPMRSELLTDPKVARLAQVLSSSEGFLAWMQTPGAQRCLVVGALLQVWAWARQHAKDDLLPGVDFAQLDALVGAPGLASAMQAVGWAQEVAGGVVLPEFAKYNGPPMRLKRPERSGASTERVRRHRQKSEPATAPSTATAPPAEAEVAPKRARRPPQPLPPLPKELDTPEFKKAWEEWATYRRQRAKPLTPLSIKRQWDMLLALGPAEAVKSIEQSILRGWEGLFPPREGEHANSGASPKRPGRIDAPPGKYDRFRVGPSPQEAALPKGTQQGLFPGEAEGPG